MRISLLGPLQVRSDEGTGVNVGGPRPRSLLALLALNAGRVVTTDQLIEGLYGQDPPDGAVNALQSQVSRLRRGLRAAGVTAPIEMRSAGYRLGVDPEQVDVHRFARLAEEGRRSLDAGEFRHAAALLREAVGLWRGAALADVAGAPFAAGQAVRLAERRVAAVEDLAEAELAVGRHAALVTPLREAVEEHPLRERLRGQLMRALAGAGRQAEALAVFEDARRLLADELGADPSAELAEVHLAVLRGEVRPRPRRTAPGPDGAGAVVPAPVSSFVGREGELARVGDLLASGRLVTLVGPGGVGKTRLALEVTGRAVERTGVEAWFVDLALVDADAPAGGVAEAVVAALGLHDAGSLHPAKRPPAGGGATRPDPAGRLVAALAEREALLVLDNCEHVVARTAHLVRRLLGACRRVRVLATSREALGITGESLCPVAPLEVPVGTGTDPATVTPEWALGFAAVRLFVDRAVAVRPDFALGGAEAGSVLRICATLDGLPLAIELAAARLRALPLSEVEARLGDRFRLLARGERTAVPRHRTLRAVVEWSWDLLDGREQALARRLTVFAGGAPLAAVEEVCAGDGVDDPVEAAAGLVDRSLAEVDASGRYRMLETVRQFCAERLAESGEEARSREAHAEWFLRLAAEAEPFLRRSEQLEWLRRLDAEHANLLAALNRSVAAAPDRALRLVALLSGYWLLRGLRAEVAQLAAALLHTLGQEVPDGLEDEYVLCVLAARADGRERPGQREWWRRAESIMSARSTPPRYPYLSFLWAVAAGPTAASQRRPETHVGADPWSQALQRMGNGYVALFAGDVGEAAEREFDAALRGFRAVGDRLGTAETLDAVATLASRRGHHARSLRLWAEGIAAAVELGAAAFAVNMRCNRGYGLLGAGDLDAARADFAWAQSRARRGGLREELGAARCGLGEVARLDGDLAQARRQFELALREAPAEATFGEVTRVRALVGLGRVAEADGDLEGALAAHREALDTALRGGDLDEAAGVVAALAAVAVVAGDGERAAWLLGLGRAVRGGEPGVGAETEPATARTAARARELVGAHRFDQAHRRGASMTVEAALAGLGVTAATDAIRWSRPR
ncbi:BTAD domain-containing putative transcriptional regulator [Phytohabitans sp. ZYX-F-186]|uniref:BTAD domain-containing putative transcriptional regulator n=1 Tax=Phytohabitans maris TaxID=3071409 RepID=A0ABU0ZP30_9ACTN|nr:BTAD domain-containing putative transcriptional regulator [Phytohabitans sp. ZYX-F-186]MDQ7908786.1 BTAD domain-containing putative transcriptional regulator [Phytohabitans sp. ZYX-F-186]